MLSSITTGRHLPPVTSQICAAFWTVCTSGNCGQNKTFPTCDQWIQICCPPLRSRFFNDCRSDFITATPRAARQAAKLSRKPCSSYRRFGILWRGIQRAPIFAIFGWTGSASRRLLWERHSDAAMCRLTTMSVPTVKFSFEVGLALKLIAIFAPMRSEGQPAKFANGLRPNIGGSGCRLGTFCG